MSGPGLPVEAVIPQVLQALSSEPSVVLQAPPGAGKTTRVPPALLDAGLAGEGRVVVLEPRRLAARAAARRIAAERGVRLGEEVGYQVRFDRRAGPKTRLLVATHGVLLRRLQDDPFLEGVGVVVLDELHERSLEADLVLAMVRRVQAEVRPDLKLVLMSATLQAEALAAALQCQAVQSEGRLHPVRIEHEPRPDPRPLEVRVAEAVRQALPQGDVLVFLPGMREIRRCASALADLSEVAVLPLHGDLPLDDQDRALTPQPGRRRVVLATNVAESSLTVPGVRAVVDSGLARVLRLDRRLGLDRLDRVRISRASAEQRAGRAGREGPGLCLRLWTEREALRPYEEPEVHRVDLAGAVLQLRCWGERDPRDLPWFELPSVQAVRAAEALLGALGALDPRGPTPLGHALSRLPLHPRLGRLLLEGHRTGHGEAAALAVALLAERDPFPRDREAAGHPSPSDLLDRVEALQGRKGRQVADPEGARRVRRVADQLLGLLRHEGAARSASMPIQEALGRAVLAAWPDRLVRRRGPGSPRGLMVGGRGVVLASGSAVREPELFVAIDVEATGEAEDRVWLASGVERDWLPVREEESLRFDPERERVVAERVRRVEDLVLQRAVVSAGDPTAVAEALCAAARQAPDRALDLDDPEVARLRARVAFLAEAMPELGLSPLNGQAVLEVLPELCIGRRSFEELRRAPLLEALRQRLGWQGLQALDRHAPERLEVPSGSRVRLDYQEGRPVLAVRMQELFGLAETPRVAGGRVPVLLHLLAPNQRPQQVTDDLAGFWARTWPEVRKELRARYPRHAWPEDPLTARPERRPGRRRG